MDTKHSVLITGASKGLGRQLALEFAKGGSHVIAHGRDERGLASVADDVRSQGGACETVSGELTSDDTLDRLATAAAEHAVDILVNNAGVYLNAPLAGMESPTLRRVLDTNLVAPILLTQRLLPHFKQRGGGLMVFINSFAGMQGSDGEGVYAASKHGLRGFAKSFRFEALRDQILVLEVYAGAMNTEMVVGRKDAEKVIQPDDAARLIVSVCGDYPSLRLDEIHVGRRRY